MEFIPSDGIYSLSLKEWVRGLTALVLLFDIYTVYQYLQLQRMRRRLAERDRLFHLLKNRKTRRRSSLKHRQGRGNCPRLSKRCSNGSEPVGKGLETNHIVVVGL